MRAILIDPVAKTVTDTLVASKVRDIYACIGSEEMDTVQLRRQEHLHFGYPYAEAPVPGFIISGHSHVIRGKAVVLGDEGGSACDTLLTADYLRPTIRFVS